MINTLPSGSSVAVWAAPAVVMSPVRLKTPVDCPNTLEVKLVRLKSKTGNRKDRVRVSRIMVSPLAERRSRSFLHRVATLEFAEDAINVLQMAFVCYVPDRAVVRRKGFTSCTDLE